MHRAKEVKAFVQGDRRRLKLFVLPPYSPGPNPDELVWAHLKHHAIGKRAFHVVGRLRKMLREHMERLRGSRSLVRAVFDEPHVRYAKA